MHFFHVGGKHYPAQMIQTDFIFQESHDSFRAALFLSFAEEVSMRPFICGKETQIEKAEPITFYHCKLGAIEMFDNALKGNGCTWDAFLGESLQYGAMTRLVYWGKSVVHTDLSSFLQ